MPIMLKPGQFDTVAVPSQAKPVGQPKQAQPQQPAQPVDPFRQVPGPKLLIIPHESDDQQGPSRQSRDEGKRYPCCDNPECPMCFGSGLYDPEENQRISDQNDPTYPCCDNPGCPACFGSGVYWPGSPSHKKPTARAKLKSAFRRTKGPK